MPALYNIFRTNELSSELLRAGVNTIMELLSRLYLQRIMHKSYKQELGPHYFANILVIKENEMCLSSLRNIGFDALYNLHDPSSYIPHFIGKNILGFTHCVKL